MLITKFNKMVRNRFLWSLFAFIVCICFIGVFTPSQGPASNETNKATIMGRSISDRDYATARYYELGLKHDRRSDLDEKTIASRTWDRIITRTLADKLGIVCADAEIAELKGRDPRFKNNNGVFSVEQYNMAVRRLFETTPEIFEDYIRDEAIRNKMLMLCGAMAWTSPYELNQRLIAVTDTITAEYAIISNTTDLSNIKASDEDARKIFENDPEFFRIPEQVSVKYFKFPVASVTNTAEISYEAVSNYYEDHMSDYSWRDTNDVLTTIPLADVSNSIASNLLMEASIEKTRETATDFAVALMPNKSGKLPDIEAVSAKFGVTHGATPLFSLTDPVPGMEEVKGFNLAAFELAPGDPDRRVSEALAGPNFVCVLVANERKDSFIPSFDQVKDKAAKVAAAKAAAEAFSKKVKTAEQSIKDLVGKGKTFAEAAAKQKLPHFRTQPFSALSARTNDMPYAELMSAVAMKLSKGEISEPMETGHDAFLITYIANKEPGDPMASETLRPQLLNALSYYRGIAVLREWSRQIQKESQIREPAVPAAEPESSEEKSSSTPKEQPI